MKSMEVLLFVLLMFLGIAGFWYWFFRRKEKLLLDSLQKMLHNAIKGNLIRQDISESKLSSFEDDLKRYLDHSLLLTEDQKEQKKLTQGLISDISHQTLTPISNIKIYSELLSERVEGSYEELETIREQVAKLDFLIQSLVKLSRLENGIVTVQVEASDVAELLLAMEQTYSAKAKEKQIEMKIAYSDLKAKFDIKWTIEALGNIVENALKYTEHGGSVWISAQAYSMFVRIDVKDSGIGMKEEEINCIFARFYRSPQVSREPGVGIGLYLAREIIQAQNGYIKVSSQESEGSVFSVFLPV